MKRYFLLLLCTSWAAFPVSADLIDWTSGPSGIVPMSPGAVSYTITNTPAAGNVGVLGAGVTFDNDHQWTGGDRYLFGSSSYSSKITFSQAIPIDWITVAGWDFNTATATVTISGSGTADTMDLSLDPGFRNPALFISDMIYAPATGTLTPDGRSDGHLFGNSRDTVEMIEIATDAVDGSFVTWGFNQTVISAVPVTAVPEPSPMMLLGLILPISAGIATLRKRVKNHAPSSTEVGLP